MRTLTAVLSQLVVDGYSPLTKHVDIVHDKDEESFYLQLFDGENNIVSEKTYSTPISAIKAFQHNEVCWGD